ncbi:DUF4982 domain-containing protein [Candidatus Pristimantibacillus sp. PTI5]|uniref:DUF4982 domain-containing protein n=1 Tax=Candidatus Pristimantibacillus sp. PTI5 TaxID=3400422 RepID=UPI003B026B53
MPYAHVSCVPAEPTLFIATQWTPSSAADITVYSNCEQIKLYLNGRLVGIKEPDLAYADLPHAPFRFEGLSWEPGTLTAEGIWRGAVAAKDAVSTPEAPDHLTLTVDECGMELQADGSDFIIVHVFVRDARGTVVPDAYHQIKFNLSGPGEIIGDGDSRVGANEA